ncbi:MAG: hypothetical protein GEU79_13715 [Acidimicrobiia bacterium]|nr:hypothetical protein [Acidimicrobiia bacterium]
MSVASAPRPDLSSHAHAMRAGFAAVVKELREILGARLVAYIGGVNETRAVHQWADADRQPGLETQRHLRLAFQIASMIVEVDDRATAQAWFQGLNPQLDDHSPARLLREGNLDEVGPTVAAAARAFVAGG